jgi:hypothetical protein
MLRGLLFCAALVAVVGSTTYGSQQPAPADPSPALPQQATPLPEPDSPHADIAPRLLRSVAGIYLCEGANPDGSPYQGLVEIVAVDKTYLIHWVMADGAEVVGVGIRNSDVLSVSYFGGTPAVAVYRIDGDRLVGEWTMGGAEGMLYTETLTRMPDQKPEPGKREPERQRRTRPVVGKAV